MVVRLLIFFYILSSCSVKKNYTIISSPQITKTENICNNNWFKISIGDKKEKVEKDIGASHSHELIDFYYRCFYNEGTVVYTNNNLVIAINNPKCKINISKMDSFKQKACELWNSVKNGMKLVEVKKILGDENSIRNNGSSTTLIYGKYSVTISSSNEVISVFGPECFK